MVLQTKHHQLLLIAVNISFLLSHAERPSYAPPPPPAPTTVSVHHSVSGSVLSLYWPQGHDRLSTLFLVPFIFLSYCLISSFSMFDIVFIKFLPLSEHTEVATSLYGSPSSLSVLLFPGLSPLTKGLVQKGLTWLMSFGKATEEFLFNIKFQNLALVYSTVTCCALILNASLLASCLFCLARWHHGKQTSKTRYIYFHVFPPPFHLFMFIPLPPLVCEPFLIRVLSHLSSISKCLPPQGLWATILTAIWPTTISAWEGAPEAPAG